MIVSHYTLHDSLGFLVGTAGRAISNGISRKFRERGFTATTEHWVILVQLWNEDGQTQTELAEKTGKDEPAVSRLIQNMIARNLIIRKTDPADKRCRRIYLTEKGNTQQKELMALVQETLTEATAHIAKDDVATTKKVLRQIATNLEK